MSFARKFGEKYDKKFIDTATKTGIDAAKTASKRVVQKTTEAVLVGNKIADKITSVGKTKTKEKENTNKQEEIYISHQRKDNKLLMILNYFE